MKGLRHLRSWAMANIILDNHLFDEWYLYYLAHPKIKSKVRSANLFLMKKKLLYKPVVNCVHVNMDSLIEYVTSD